MKVLVTGATGFLGGALARRLRRLGHQVHGSGRDPLQGAALQRDGIRFSAAELDDPLAAMALCRGQHWVFHCGALSTAWGRREDFRRSNVLGTRLIAAAARKRGVKRLIHVSSPSVCMDRQDRLGIGEGEALPAAAVNHYAWSKRLAEDEIAAAAAHGLATITLRPQAIVGPGDRAIFPRILRVAARGSFPRVGGPSLIDVTPLENAVDALLLAAKAPLACLGQVYHISNGSPRDIDTLLDSLFQSLGMDVKRPRLPFGLAYAAAGVLELIHRSLGLRSEPLLTRYSVLVLGRSRTLDISKARRELGYRPKVSVEAAIRAFAAAWKAQHGA
jgi:nucleoside-diphosphate-sugar epimerase